MSLGGEFIEDLVPLLFIVLLELHEVLGPNAAVGTAARDSRGAPERSAPCEPPGREEGLSRREDRDRSPPLLANGKVVAPADVLVAMELLAPEQLEDWRRARVPLERVINCILTRLSRLLRILRFHAHSLKLLPSDRVLALGQGTEASAPLLQRPAHLPVQRRVGGRARPRRHAEGGETLDLAG
ncbi:MAG TPA: hypothetical protein VMK12_32715 [Anaeromyxobacteraceae bacterium]|nr:hypothetical protein [Anaeromyxobacteraceae bacterium]